MQRRSWMAALTTVALVGSATWAEGQAPTQAAEVAPAAPTPRSGDKLPSVKRKVALNLHLAGLKYQSVVTVKPGNAACRFAPITVPIRNIERPTATDPIEVEVLTADRNCSLVITIAEGGQPPHTIRRNFQIEPADPAKPTPQVFDCYLSGVAKNPTAIARKPTESTATAVKK